MPVPKVVATLRWGGIAVIPTDTIYGIVARALDKSAVERLYKLRRLPAQAGTTSKKPFIILIDRSARLREFGIHLTPAQKIFLKKVWPGRVSVILPCPQKKFSYLHLGTKALGFRVPQSRRLEQLLKKIGPLVAPSANPEGKRPAHTITEAKKYFGNVVDVYVNVGRRLQGKPSTLVSLFGLKPSVLREGAGTVSV